ncbi:YccT family protein [Vibrio sp. WJH972]
MSNKRFLVLGISLLSSLVVEAATLTVDSTIELMAIDGKKITKSELVKGTLSDISAGEHQLVYRFRASLRDGSMNRLYSTTPNVSFIQFNADDQLSIVLPRLRSYSQANAYFKRDPLWTLVNQKGDEYQLEYDALPGQGFMPYADIEKPLAAYNLAQGNQYAQDGATKVVTDEVMQGGNDLSLLNTFKLLYNNATEEQRDQIKQWLAEQEK